MKLPILQRVRAGGLMDEFSALEETFNKVSKALAILIVVAITILVTVFVTIMLWNYLNPHTFWEKVTTLLLGVFIGTVIGSAAGLVIELILLAE